MKNISTQKERILQFIDYKGISKNKFYKETGISNGVLDKKSGLSMDTVEKFYSTFSEVSPEWLLTGEGPMLKEGKPYYPDHLVNTDEIVIRKLRTDTIERDVQSVPYYNITATASIVEAFTGEAPEIPMEHISIPNLPKCDGALNITGDSMYPLLKSGDIVMYRNVNDVSNIIWGEMYLMYLNCHGDEFFFCKYIHKAEKEGFVKLVSQNKHHEAKEFPISCIKQLAIVKASIRINSVI